MATFRDPEQLRRAQIARFKNAQRSAKLAHDKAARELVENKAKALLSGTVPESTIKKLHPWARRHGAAMLPKLPVNQHTGRLKNSVRLVPYANGWRLIITAAYAPFVLAIGGTKRMMARGFWTELKKSANRIHERVEKAIQEAHRR